MLQSGQRKKGTPCHCQMANCQWSHDVSCFPNIYFLSNIICACPGTVTICPPLLAPSLVNAAHTSLKGSQSSFVRGTTKQLCTQPSTAFLYKQGGCSLPNVMCSECKSGVPSVLARPTHPEKNLFPQGSPLMLTQPPVGSSPPQVC